MARVLATPDGHEGMMPAFGRDGILTKAQINDVADYVRSLSNPTTDRCFGGKAGFRRELHPVPWRQTPRAIRDVGAPNLTTKIWLYGGDKATIVETLTNGRGGHMPAWGGKLDPATIKSLTVFVHSLGGGQ